MTIEEMLNKGKRMLKEAGIQEADLDAWYLLEFVTGVSRAMYFAMPDQNVSKEEQEQYEAYIEKRSSHIPLQHLTGEQQFMGLDFQVTQDVLIPRQDTEILVEEAISMIQGPQKILDVCTGSGCILLSILHYVKKEKKISLTGMGIDISEKALAIAEKNAKNLGIDASFMQSDLFENVTGKWNMIVSNPPYIRTEVIHTLQDEVKLHDPWIALDGKEDGLYFYKKIIEEAGEYLERDGTLLFEIGHDQAEDVMGLLKEAGYSNVRVKKDLAGLDRVVIGVYDRKVSAKD